MDPKDFVRRGALVQDLLTAVHAQGDEPALGGGLLHLGRRGALHDLGTQGLLDRQELVDGCTAGIAGVEALLAPFSVGDLAVDLFRRHADLLELGVPLRVDRNDHLAALADGANQALGDHHDERARDEVGLDTLIHHPRDRARRVVGVHR